MDGIVMDVVRRRVKNLTLRVSATSTVKVTVPLHVSAPDITRAIESRLPWIKAKQAKFEAHKASSPKPLEYTSGETHYFLGQPHILTVFETKQKPRIRRHTEGEEEYLYMYVRQDMLGTEAKPMREAVLYSWYRGQLKAMIPALAEKWEAVIGEKVSDWGIRRMKTRWGTCNIRSRKIWLNLELIRRPLGCLEYIVVHEMVHLLEASHNKRFHSFMDGFLPDWRRWKTELNGG